MLCGYSRALYASECAYNALGRSFCTLVVVLCRVRCRSLYSVYDRPCDGLGDCFSVSVYASDQRYCSRLFPTLLVGSRACADV